MSKKSTALWREAHFEVKSVKNWGSRRHFGRSDVVSYGRWRGLCIQRWQAWEIWRGSAQMHFSWQAQYKRHLQQRCSELKELISWEGLHFGVSNHQLCQDAISWQVQHFVWPGLTFSWQAQYFRDTAWKIAKRIGTRPSAVQSTSHFWRKSRRIASFLKFSTAKSKKVSQNCFVFDVANRSLAALFCCRRGG